MHPLPSWLEPARPLLTDYAALLAGPGVERGLIGPREVPRLWDRHILNCAVVAEPGGVVPQGASVIDVGSGAGLPGLVWAIARPDLHLTLLEPLLRRATFLQEVVDQLGLTNAAVDRGRAEDSRLRARIVTARAVAPLAKLLEWCMPLVEPGGSLVALKGAAVQDEIAALPSGVAERVSVRTFGQAGAEGDSSALDEDRLIEGLSVPTTVVVVDAG